MTSSSRGGDEKSGGVRSHSSSSAAPSAVMWKPFWGPSSAVSSDSTSPSRSRRCSVVYTCPDVERPHLAGAGLELLAQLQPVLGALAEQGQQGVADAHSFTGPWTLSVTYLVSY